MSISDCPKRWQRRAISILYFPCFWVLMTISLVLAGFLEVWYAMQAWYGAMREHFEFFIVDSCRLMQRTWNK